MPTIRVEPDVFAGLQKVAQPFTDTPNSVIRRLLEQAGVLAEANVTDDRTPESAPEKSGGKSVQPVYIRHLLYVLAHQFNGKGQKHDVCKAVVDLMERRGMLSEADHKLTPSGETRAENIIGWCRFALKGRGLISSDSPRGVWELTDAGKEEGLRTDV